MNNIKKNILLFLFLLPSLVFGQTIQPISPWKYETPYPNISTINTSSSVRIPFLGSVGSPCLSVGATGIIATTTCLSSGGAITSLNGLTTSTQLFATSTASNLFRIVSSGNTHTFTIPSNVGFFTNDSGYLTSSIFPIPVASTSLTAGSNISINGNILSAPLTFTAGGGIQITSSSPTWTFINGGVQTLTGGGNVTVSQATGTVTLGVTSGYSIPLTASTTNWETFYQTPSNRITAGTGLSWSGNTLNNTFTTFTTTTINGLSSTAYTFATSGNTGLSISGSGSTLTWTQATSTGSQAGFLSSADWTTFNNKFTLPSLTAGSVLFSDGTTISQDNANLFYDNTNNRLGIGTSTPPTALSLDGDQYTNILSQQSLYGYTELVQHNWSASGGLLFNAYKVNPAVDGDLFTTGNTKLKYSGGAFSEGAAAIGVILNSASVNGGTIRMYTATSGTAGDNIVWTQLVQLNKNSIWLSPSGTSSNFYINSSGNIGIGNSNPASKLDVSLSLNEMVRLGTQGVASAIWGTNIGFISENNSAQISAASTFPIDFYTGGTYGTMTEGTLRMRLTTGGNLGIGLGATNPSTSLEVWNNTSGDQVRIGKSATEYYKIGRSTATGFLEFNGPQTTYSGYSFLTDSGEKVTINNDGNVGIGTYTPTSKLNVIGDLHIGNSTTSGRIIQQRGYGQVDLTADEVARHGAYFGLYNNYTGVPAGSDFYGIHNQSRLIMSQSYTSYSYLGYDSQISINNNGSPFTLTNAIGLRVIATQKDNASTTITNDYSAIISAPTLGATRNVTMQVGNAGAPVAGNWNLYGDSTYNNYLQSSLGIGITSITARLHLPAGTATASTAPLKFTTGTNLTTPENGAIEFDGTHLFLTEHAARRTFARTISSTFPSNKQIISSNGSYLIGSDNYIWDNSNLRVGLYTTTPSYNIGFGGTFARTIGVERSATGVGVDFTLSSGGGISGGTNTNGGDLYIKSGQTTGTGESNVYIQTLNKSSGVGSIVTTHLTLQGFDYQIDDQLTFDGGNGNATVTVTAIDGGGEIMAYTLDTGGSGYTTGLYSMLGGSGQGSEISVDSIAQTDDNTYNTLAKFGSDYKTLFGTSMFYLDENAASIGRKRAGVFTGTTPWDYAGTVTSLNAFTIDGILLFRDQTNTSHRANFLVQSSRFNVDVYNDTLSQYMDQLWTAKTLDFRVGTAGTTYGLYVDASGRTGINKITPAYTLDVNGTANVTAGGGIRFGGSAYSNIVNSGADQVITHSQNIVSIIDADNNSTTNYFSWGKNGTTFGGATELMRLSEDGTVAVTSFIKTGGDWRVGTQLDKSTTTFSNITNLSATLVAGKKYAFKIVLYVNADNVGGHKYDLNGGTATATNVIWQLNSISNGAVAHTITSRQVALNGAPGGAGAMTVYTEITGSILVNAAGTFIPRFAQNAMGGAGNSSVLVGSFMEIRELN